MKNIKRNSYIILIITIIILYFILKDDFNDIINTLLNANIGWLLLALVIYFLYFITDQLSFYNMIKQYNKDVKLKFVIYLGVITKFFNGITPLASGGQPMQVYEMHKQGVSVSNGTNIVIQNYIVFQIAFVIWAIIAYILNHAMHLFQRVPLLQELTTIGFIINGLILVVLFLISFSKNFNRNVINWFINVIAKFNKKMNKEKQIEKWNNYCDEYYENAQVLIKNGKIFIRCIFYQFLSLGFYYAIPFFLAYAIGVGKDLSFINTMVAGEYIFIMGCYVPIPGASGGMEYGFLGFFGNFLTGYSLSTLMVLWRFLTYYLPTIIGAIFFNIGPGKDVKEAIKKGEI
jgi:glycosyltransferase 2 family protein